MSKEKLSQSQKLINEYQKRAAAFAKVNQTVRFKIYHVDNGKKVLVGDNINAAFTILEHYGYIIEKENDK
tara:strand:- start:50 stop:259 length:210 start_codon:yes stop_codon:yes gene_type:complete